jgi:hypothetical protein
MKLTGEIEKLGHLGRGDHVCWLVDDAETYAESAATILAGAHALRQKPVAFGPEGSPALMQLEPMAAIAADPYVKFLDRGPFVPETMLVMFREQSALARAEGYDGLRLVADMDWLLSGQPTIDAIIGFELLLIGGHRSTPMRWSALLPFTLSRAQMTRRSSVSSMGTDRVGSCRASSTWQLLRCSQRHSVPPRHRVPVWLISPGWPSSMWPACARSLKRGERRTVCNSEVRHRRCDVSGR